MNKIQSFDIEKSINDKRDIIGLELYNKIKEKFNKDENKSKFILQYNN